MALKDKIAIESHPANKVVIENLSFKPAPGMASPHIQTVVPIFFRYAGKEPPSDPLVIPLGDGDALYCKISTPHSWKAHHQTVVLLHGLGGSDSSSYMTRLSRKFFQKGLRCVRINLRGVGNGNSVVQRPYHGGTSHDVLQVIQSLKQRAPESPLTLIGFSLGGNITLKLLGELSERAKDLIERAFAICAPIDLAHTMQLLFHPSNHLYHLYYVKGLKQMGSRWIGQESVRSIPDFDNVVTARQWGFKDASDYYQQCSSKFFLSKIKQTCHLIFAADDPFIDYRSVLGENLPPQIKLFLSPHGGHMGFWGWAGREHRYHWLDAHLLNTIAANNLTP